MPFFFGEGVIAIGMDFLLLMAMQFFGTLFQVEGSRASCFPGERWFVGIGRSSHANQINILVN